MSTTVLDVMTDKKLLGGFFKRRPLRGDPWRAWRAFLSALFGLPLDAADRVIVQKHTARTDVPASQFSEAFVVCGRRSGKSVIAALVAIFLACFRDYSAVLAPGEIGVLPIVAPDRKQCRVILNYIAGFFDASPALASLVKSRLKESIELTNRVRIEVHTANFRTVRGYTAIGCIVDEVAFLRDESSANPDRELIAAITPAMSTIPGALLLGISSPYARHGALWEAYREHFGKDGAPTLIWQAETRAMNPTVSRVVIEAAYLRDRAAASAEYGAQFRSDIESFLDADVVEACTTPGRFELAPNSSHSYVGFCDPSGGRADSMTLAIAHTEGEKVILDALREVEAPFSPESVTADFANMLKRYHLSEVTGDKYGGEWPREQFEKRGITYQVAEQSRSELYLELLPAVTSGMVELLEHRRLANQLTSLERRTGRGKDSVDHGPGGHDDVANAAAGALVIAMERSGGVFGLVDFLASGAAEQMLREMDEKPAPKPLQVARPAPSARPTITGDCPNCGPVSWQTVSGQLRCPDCGFQKWPGPAPQIPRVGRADVFRRRL